MIDELREVLREDLLVQEHDESFVGKEQLDDFDLVFRSENRVVLDLIQIEIELSIVFTSHETTWLSFDDLLANCLNAF